MPELRPPCLAVLTLPHTTVPTVKMLESPVKVCMNKYFVVLVMFVILLQLGALKGLFDWQTAPRTWRVVWRCATVEVGALSVTIALVHLMQMSLAGSSAFLTLVSELRFFLGSQGSCMHAIM